MNHSVFFGKMQESKNYPLILVNCPSNACCKQGLIPVEKKSDIPGDEIRTVCKNEFWTHYESNGVHYFMKKPYTKAKFR